jgi:hypothetical protein
MHITRIPFDMHITLVPLNKHVHYSLSILNYLRARKPELRLICPPERVQLPRRGERDGKVFACSESLNALVIECRNALKSSFKARVWVTLESQLAVLVQTTPVHVATDGSNDEGVI